MITPVKLIVVGIILQMVCYICLVVALFCAGHYILAHPGCVHRFFAGL
jgi:hypothetical protein